MSLSKTKRFALSCMVALLPVMAACSGTNGDKQGQNDATSKPVESSPAVEEKIDMNSKYDPPITLTTFRGSVPEYFYPEETMDKNAIYDAYERDLGITLKNNWVVDSKEYHSKLKISIAANDLADFFLVSAEDLTTLVESDMVMDLTEAYEKYADEKTKKMLTSDGGKQMKSATFNGKLMAIPQTNSPFNSAEMVWVRKDWLKEMNLPEPKTMQDVLAISEAFATRDSGGKGKVFGLGLNKETISQPLGFLNGYHAYPGQWVKDSSGKLVYGSVQPEVKTALKQLQDLYKAGQIDPEAAVNDDARNVEYIANDRLGLIFGQFWYSAALQDAVVKDNKVTQDWGVYMIPSIDDKPGMTQVSATVNSFYVINKNAKNPEAVFKLLNHWVGVLTGGLPAEGEPRAVYSFGKELKETGKEVWAVNPLVVLLQDLYIQGGEHITEALKTNDPSAIEWSGDLKNRYEQLKKYEAGDTTFWLQSKIAGEEGAFTRMYEYFKEDRYHFNEFYGTATPTMIERDELLKTKEKEMFAKIIIGSASIDEFDKFVEEWNKLGGEKITEEVNDWYANMQ
jgi:putative aldouronate transport system substrate-binding protein